MGTNNTCYISVIVPIYNTEKYLHRCIDSILSQTFTDFELLLINDGSTDKSSVICDKYAKIDSRIRVFHKKNEGRSCARNTGLDNAKGQFIAFVDSDDWVDEYFLSNFVKEIKSEIDIYIQSYCNSSINMKHFYGDKKDFIEIFHNTYIVGFIWNKLFKKSLIDKYHIRFKKEFNLYEDEVFVFSILKHVENIVFAPDCSYHYNIPDFNSKYFDDNFEPKYSVFNSITHIYKKQPQIRVYTFYIKQLYRALFDSYIKQNRKTKNKLKRFLQIYNNNPFVHNEFTTIQRIVFRNKHIAHIFLKFIAFLRRKTI